jgi:starch synthase (maltosyl-transferring)
MNKLVGGIRDGRERTIIEGVWPEIDAGHYAIKRTIGDRVRVEADIFTDGHDQLSCALLYRKVGDQSWYEELMQPLVNDRWVGEFYVTELGRYEYTLLAWVDRFKSWQRDLRKRVDAGQDVTVDLRIGAALVHDSSQVNTNDIASKMRSAAELIRNGGDLGLQEALSGDLGRLMERYGQRLFPSTYGRHLPVTVDRERARFSSWYEMFPRSAGPGEQIHGTFKDCEARLPYIAEMGFDILYFPPIHPIGQAFRKGKNNSTQALAEDLGSPWAIGGKEGGHKAIHPQLGSLEDFRQLVAKAKKNYGIDVALDIAFQCSPDHPYVTEHPEWFRKRPDGTIQYAENPPKKYQDIYPFDFETSDWQGLWDELKSVIEYWIQQGVTVFRVDNPHTKSFRFWEWCIADLKDRYPETIFLSEAFTRPKVMKELAKLGFTQSYTYFTWRNHKWDLMEYFTELTQTEMREYFRPNPWPNTPDILHEFLQTGGRPAFLLRLVLAATLAANYGIYGPAFELFEGRPVRQGSEEYLDSEKYQIRRWDIHRPDSLKTFIGRINSIRRANIALQRDDSLRFHGTDHDQLMCYSKQTPDHRNRIVTVVSLDPHFEQSGWVEMLLEPLGLDPARPYTMHDLINDAHYTWQGGWNYVKLNPHQVPAHIFRVTQ